MPLLAALALLTRIPVRRAFSRAEMGQAPPFFPVVGTLVGVGQMALLHVFAPYLPPVLVAVCLLAAAAWVTGALHLDGLADAADGFAGGEAREETLRIMRDPAIGTYGAVALALVLMARAGALTTLIERGAANRFLVLTPTLGRWTMVAIGYLLPYARSEGGLGSLAAETTRSQFALATAIAIGVSIAAGAGQAIVGWGAAVAVAATSGRLVRRRLGGFTGDTLGATSELTEAAVLMAAVVMTR